MKILTSLFISLWFAAKAAMAVTECVGVDEDGWDQTRINGLQATAHTVYYNSTSVSITPVVTGTQVCFPGSAVDIPSIITAGALDTEWAAVLAQHTASAAAQAAEQALRDGYVTAGGLTSFADLNSGGIQIYRQATAPSPVPTVFALWEDTSSNPTKLHAAMNDADGTRIWLRATLLDSYAGSQSITLRSETGSANVFYFYVNNTLTGYWMQYGTTAAPVTDFVDSHSVWLRNTSTGTSNTSKFVGDIIGRSGKFKVGGTTWLSFTSKGNTALTDTSLWAPVLLANTLGTDGDSVNIYAYGTCPTLVSTVTPSIKFGSTTMLTKVVSAAQCNSGTWRIDCDITRIGEATQRAWCRLLTVSAAGVVLTFASYSTPTETLSGAVTIDVRGNATNANDLLFLSGKGRFEPANP